MVDRDLWEQVDADLYKVLDLPASASEDAIQQAWHREARRVHPDVGGDPVQFQSVHIAYVVLSDPDLRRRYDTRLLTSQTPRSQADGSGITQSEAFPDARVNTSAPAPPSSPRVLWLMALVGCFCLVMAYLVPWTTLVTGVVVGVFVMTRYLRLWRTRL